MGSGHSFRDKLYFGYGSNLWREQMLQRCPTSEYVGIARLDGFHWIINERGYANVVETSKAATSAPREYTGEVWGLVYSLQADDEDKLDRNEGVPFAYTKEKTRVHFWRTKGGGKPNVTGKPEEVEVLIYIDRKRAQKSTPKDEYVYRMNKGIRDAVHEGMPKGYVQRVMRQYIPDVHDEKVEEVARKQAILFEDEGSK
ncbi:hypothetical protein M433DRAFT_251903 [Acidomyces richmondensis BFW]|nr:MAG: hypothetical protein FE78DRAFT_71545 [Acidomyces sp. 'richmondensis']KYG49770.1 hypothetical protein M433DRAFT_251903 [Acidomyces richmondensis BFW]